jgi:hypothetical protein
MTLLGGGTNFRLLVPESERWHICTHSTTLKESLLFPRLPFKKYIESSLKISYPNLHPSPPRQPNNSHRRLIDKPPSTPPHLPNIQSHHCSVAKLHQPLHTYPSYRHNAVRPNYPALQLRPHLPRSRRPAPRRLQLPPHPAIRLPQRLPRRAARANHRWRRNRRRTYPPDLFLIFL